ncbi:lachesin [Cherax quadricarinatus]
MLGCQLVPPLLWSVSLAPQVGWLKVDSQTILSLQKRVVTHNSRISVTHDEHRTWNLHIRQVQESDNGCYMCQINTQVMKNQVGCIKVHVPPDIINELTSSDATINEGDTVNLRCVAEGYPTPEIKWKREDGRGIVIKSSGRDGSKTFEAVPGSNLTLENVSRRQMGAYLCIASNKVPPSVSKRIIVNVNFSPVVKADNQLIGSPLETNVEIQCHVEAFPMAVNYWERENGEIILNGRKYKLNEEKDSYRVTMKLVIKNFTKDDAGQYKCISTNSLGKADTSIRLYEIEVPTPRSTTEHQYHLYVTTPHSKSVNSLDLRRREGGQSRHLDGAAGSAGADGATAGLGVDFDKEQSRQRQRQRLEFGGDGRTDNGYPGGKFGLPEGHEEQGSGSASSRTHPRESWFASCLEALVLWSLALVLVVTDPPHILL